MRSRNSFTLIELLVCIAIIGVLAAMLVPILSHAREKSRRINCASNLRQLGIALQLYAEDHDGSFPDEISGLIVENYISESKIFSCPSDGPPPVDGSKDNDYAYLGSGNDNRMSGLEGFMLAADKDFGTNENRFHTGNFYNILYMDGHVEGKGN